MCAFGCCKGKNEIMCNEFIPNFDISLDIDNEVI